MKKFKNMKKRDEKIESLLMEKWGYSAPILREGPKEDGDKELLTEVACGGWCIAAIIVLAGGSGKAYNEFIYQPEQRAIKQGSKELYGTRTGELPTGAYGADTKLTPAQEIQFKVIEKIKSLEESGEPYTWENIIYGPGLTELDKHEIERDMRRELGNKAFEEKLSIIDEDFSSQPLYDPLQFRGIPLMKDIEEHQAEIDAGQTPVIFTDEQIQRQRDRLAGMSGIEPEDTDLEFTPEEIERGTADVSSLEGATTDYATGAPISADDLEAAGSTEYSEDETLKALGQLEENLLRNATQETLMSSKKVKDIIREEIVKYFSIRRKN